MSAPTLNVPLAEAVLKQITEHPETHRQSAWGIKISCGTAHCISGWSAVLAGAELAWDDHGMLEAVRLNPMGAWSDPFYAGMELLGIDEDLADYLFGASEDAAIGELRELISDARSVMA